MQTIDYNSNKISKLSLGTVQFGLNYGISNKDGQPQLEKVQEIVNYVLSHGINCFDTASDYGSSEEVLGKVLNKKDSYIISKLKSKNFLNNLSENVDSSLKKLNVTGIYGLLLHDSELLYDWKDNYSKTITNLITNKKVNYFGVSIYTDEDFQKAITNDAISIIQIPFSVFDQRALSLKWFEKAKKHNKLIFIRSVFLQGLIFMDTVDVPLKLSKVKKYISIFEKFSSDLNMSKNELALSFVNSVAKDSIILFGCDNISQAEENINVFNNLTSLTNEQIHKIHKSFVDVPDNIYNPAKW